MIFLISVALLLMIIVLIIQDICLKRKHRRFIVRSNDVIRGRCFEICQKQDLQNNKLLGKKSRCCNAQIIVCGIDDRAINCDNDNICDEFMCSICKKHCSI